MRVLVTGGGGFLGRYVVERLLARQYEVTILGRSPQPDLTRQGVAVIQGDIRDESALDRAVAGMQAVFHTAAKAGVWGPRREFFDTNVRGTSNLLAACLRQQVPYLVHTSTPSVVFNGEAFEGADESLPYGRGWLCHYAHSKRIAEAAVLSAHGQGGMRTLALRPHLIWGIGDPHLIPRLLERARSARLRIVGEGKNLVDITHVENAAQAHILALDALVAGRAGGKPYFLSQGVPVNLWQWINDLLRSVGIATAERRISLPVAYRMGAVLEVLYRLPALTGEPPMTRFVAVELAKSHYFSIEAARRDLGYTPEKSTAAGLAELAQHIRIHGSTLPTASAKG